MTLPSTRSSYTTSASLSPTWGRALPVAVVDLHDQRGAPDAAVESPGRPVSGATGAGAVVVVVGGRGRGGGGRRRPPPRRRRARTRRPRRRAATNADDADGDALLRGVQDPGEHEAGLLDQSSRRSAMRSSSGGWVSNMRLMRLIRPSLLLHGLRLLDPEVRGGVGGGADDRVVVAELLERGDEAGRVAGELHAGHVGEGLAPPAHGRLHRPTDERREDQQREADEGEDDREPAAAAVVVVVAVAAHAEPHEPDPDVGGDRDHARPS